MSDSSNINVNQELAYKSSLILFNQYIANASKFLNTSKLFTVQSECNIDLIVSLPTQPKTLVNTDLAQRLTVELVAKTMLGLVEHIYRYLPQNLSYLLMCLNNCSAYLLLGRS